MVRRCASRPVAQPVAARIPRYGTSASVPVPQGPRPLRRGSRACGAAWRAPRGMPRNDLVTTLRCAGNPIDRMPVRLDSTTDVTRRIPATSHKNRRFGGPWRPTGDPTPDIATRAMMQGARPCGRRSESTRRPGRPGRCVRWPAGEHEMPRVSRRRGVRRRGFPAWRLVRRGASQVSVDAALRIRGSRDATHRIQTPASCWGRVLRGRIRGPCREYSAVVRARQGRSSYVTRRVTAFHGRPSTST